MSGREGRAKKLGGGEGGTRVYELSSDLGRPHLHTYSCASLITGFGVLSVYLAARRCCSLSLADIKFFSE